MKHDRYPPEFEDAWVVYPRKVNKRGAFRAWRARVREGFDPAVLALCAEHYAASVVGKEPQFVMHGATFWGPNYRFEDYEGGAPEVVDPYAPPPEWGAGDE